MSKLITTCFILLTLFCDLYAKDVSVERDVNASGDLNISNESITVQKTTIIQGVSPEEYLRLAKKLGVAENALNKFFQIIGLDNVPIEDLYPILMKIAEDHNKLIQQLKSLKSKDQKVNKIIKKSEKAIYNGDYSEAKKYLDKAYEKRIKYFKLTAAEIRVYMGDIEIICCNYITAAFYYREAFLLTVEEYDKPEEINYLKDNIISRYKSCLEQVLALNLDYRRVFDYISENKKTLNYLRDYISKSKKALNVINIALVSYEKGDYAKSINMFEKVLALNPDDKKAHDYISKSKKALNVINIALVSYEKGDYAKSINMFERVLALNPDDKKAHDYISKTGKALYVKALTSYKNGFYAESIKMFKQVLALNPDDRKAHDYISKSEKALYVINLALASYGNGKYAESIKMFKQVLALNPDDKKAHDYISKIKNYLYDIALASYKDGFYVTSINILERVLALNPYDKKAHDYISKSKKALYVKKRALASHKNEDYAKSIDMFEQLLTLNPDDILVQRIFVEYLKIFEKKIVKIDRFLKKMTFLVFSHKVSVHDNNLRNARHNVNNLRKLKQLGLIEKFKKLKAIEKNVREIEQNLYSIPLNPVHVRVILEAAGNDPKAIHFIEAKDGVVNYLLQLKKYGIQNIDVRVALGYQDVLQNMDSIDEIKDSFPYFQADANFREQLNKAINSYSYDEGLRRLVYIVSSRRTFIIPDGLDNEIAKLKQKNISFSYIYIYSSAGKIGGRTLEKMARQTNGKSYPCKDSIMVIDALKKIFLQ